MSSDLRSPHFSEKHGIEFCIHECPPTLYSTFKMIFRDLAPLLPNRSEVASNEKDFALQVIAVWQPTKNDMSGFSDEVQDERDAKTGKVRHLAFHHYFRPPSSLSCCLYDANDSSDTCCMS